MRFGSKEALISSIEIEHRRFEEMLGSIPEDRYLDEGVWGDGWNIRDLLAHLTEWEQMFLNWYRVGLEGGHPEMPAKGLTDIEIVIREIEEGKIAFEPPQEMPEDDE